MITNVNLSDLHTIIVLCKEPKITNRRLLIGHFEIPHVNWFVLQYAGSCLSLAWQITKQDLYVLYVRFGRDSKVSEIVYYRNINWNCAILSKLYNLFKIFIILVTLAYVKYDRFKFRIQLLRKV